jgi:hypothetical protein
MEYGEILSCLKEEAELLELTERKIYKLFYTVTSLNL